MMDALHRILVIDDDADIQEVVGIALEDFGGFIIEGCTSGTAAVERAPMFKPDLILLDMAMPDMDGLTTLQALRRRDGIMHAPVVFFTAKTADPATLLHLQGVVGVIAKPFHHRHLVEQINTFWETHIQIRQKVPDTGRIAAIRHRYLQALPGHCDTIQALWTARTYTALDTIQRQVHQLAGSGASLGFAELSATATALEHAIAPILTFGGARQDIISVTAAERIDALLTLFYQAAQRSPEQPPHWLAPHDRVDHRDERF
jgi:two-component system, OmpR family, response regulator